MKVYVPELLLSTTDGLHVPVIPFVDVLGNDGTIPPAQMFNEAPKLNAGVMFGVTVTVNVAGLAHCPAVGVNVYVPGLLLSTTEGFQVPLIPLVDVLGNVGTIPPAQIFNEVPKLNVGVVLGIIVTVIVVGMPHCPFAGVKVYVPVTELLITDGFQVPLIPFVDAGGNVGGVVPAQIGGTAAKVGINIGFDKTIPIKRFVVHPLTCKEKLE